MILLRFDVFNEYTIAYIPWSLDPRRLRLLDRELLLTRALPLTLQSLIFTVIDNHTRTVIYTC